MKKLDLGQAVGILANLGVIAGIAFLAIELNQNNELLRAEAEYNYRQNRLNNRERIIEDAEYAAMWSKASRNESLDDIEDLRLRTHIEETILSWQWEFGQLVDGNRPETRDEIARRYRIPLSSGSGFGARFPEVWSYFRLQLRSDFVDFVEQEVLGSR